MECRSLARLHGKKINLVVIISSALLSLLVYCNKMSVQFSAEKQSCVYRVTVFWEILTPSLSPDTNRGTFWNRMIGQEIIALPVVSSTHLRKE